MDAPLIFAMSALAAVGPMGCNGKVATEPPSDATSDGAAETAGDAGCDFVYRDQRGSTEMGDGLCYKACTTGADCTDPTRPNCSVLGLWKGGDFICNGKVRICMTSKRNDCPLP